MHGDADYGFIISLDTQGSSRLPDTERPALRERIYQVAGLAFLQAGIGRTRRFQEDRGDGILAVVEPRRTERIAGEWVEYLHQNLRKVNAGLKVPLRLRVGLDVGPVTSDEHGFSGSAVDFACRIGNSAEAKAVLEAASGSPLLVAVSDRVYQDVVRHGGRWIEPANYRQYDVSLQEGPQRPWFMVPGLSAPPLPGEGGVTAIGGDAGTAGERRSPAAGPDAPPPDGSGRGHGDAAPAAGKFVFGPVTHSGSGAVLQGEFSEITIDHRTGGRP